MSQYLAITALSRVRTIQYVPSPELGYASRIALQEGAADATDLPFPIGFVEVVMEVLVTVVVVAEVVVTS